MNDHHSSVQMSNNISRSSLSSSLSLQELAFQAKPSTLGNGVHKNTIETSINNTSSFKTPKSDSDDSSSLSILCKSIKKQSELRTTQPPTQSQSKAKQSSIGQLSISFDIQPTTPLKNAVKNNPQLLDNFNALPELSSFSSSEPEAPNSPTRKLIAQGKAHGFSICVMSISSSGKAGTAKKRRIRPTGTSYMNKGGLFVLEVKNARVQDDLFLVLNLEEKRQNNLIGRQRRWASMGSREEIFV